MKIFNGRKLFQPVSVPGWRRVRGSGEPPAGRGAVQDGGGLGHRGRHHHQDGRAPAQARCRSNPNERIFSTCTYTIISGDLTGAGRLHGEAGTCYRKHSPSLAVAAYLKVASCHQAPLQSLNCRVAHSLQLESHFNQLNRRRSSLLT